MTSAFASSNQSANCAISVVIPTYNRAHCISSAVESVLAQTFQDFEIIVVDDGSTDNTSEVMAKFGPRVQYTVCPHRGKSATLNAGLVLARGRWLAVLDSDDEWLPRKLEHQMEALRRYPHCGLCFTDVVLKGRPSGAASVFEESEKRFPEKYGCIDRPVDYVLRPPHDIFIQASLIRRDLLDRIGQFNERLVAEDTDIIFRLALEASFAYVNEPLVVVDRTPNRSSIMELIKGSPEVDLNYRQALYEGWLKMEHRLDPGTLKRIRFKLAGVHSGWANWHMAGGRWREALAELKTANEIDASWKTSLKIFCLGICPPVVARVVRWREHAERLRWSGELKRRKAGVTRS
ncbi:MAG TPA: glycosyltransferase [Methylomirabilota bacterium]|nr:glycosyltransferase [Methylomirabilota bacterium]